MTKFRSVPYEPEKYGKELSSPIKPLAVGHARDMDHFIRYGPNNLVNLS